MPVPVREQDNVKGAAASKGLMIYATAQENYGEFNGLRGCNCKAKRLVHWGR